jgi:RimJ/RimL family protein N-acetyltransferase
MTDHPKPLVETDRLLLTRPTVDDFDAFNAMLSDPKVFRFLGNSAAPRPEAWTKLLRNIGHWDAFGYGIFAIREKDSGRYIGEIGIGHFQRGLGTDFDPFPEGAWLLASEAHGKGYATEAAEAAHEWFFALKGIQRTVCIIDPANVGSIRVAEKLGYRAFAQRDYRDVPITLFERSV